MYVSQIDKMESGCDRYEIVTHKGDKCDCGFTTSRITNGKTVRGYAQYNWKVVRIHKSRI
jgi:hypothetical protein